MPMPESFYSSILEISLKTTELAFGKHTTIKVSAASLGWVDH